MRRIAPLLFVALTLPALAQTRTVTITPFGTACGADLAGSVVRTPNGPVIRLDVTHAAPAVIAVLVIGAQVPTPTPLPNSNCGLLVHPRVTHFAQLDAAGAAAFRFPLPPIPAFAIDFQALTFTPSPTGRQVAASNGVSLVVQ